MWTSKDGIKKSHISCWATVAFRQLVTEVARRELRSTGNITKLALEEYVASHHSDLWEQFKEEQKGT